MMISTKLSQFGLKSFQLSDNKLTHYISQRFLRGSRFPKIYKSPVDSEKGNEQNNNVQDEPRKSSEGRQDQYQSEPVQEERLRRGGDTSKGYTTSRAVHERNFNNAHDESTFNRKAGVRKLLKDDSTYGAADGKGRLGGDPFMTGPYVRGTKMNVYFQQGNDAEEETQRRKIDPTTTSVIMFPGQGTQYVGMSGDTTSLPRYIRVLYEISSSILNYDLLDLCANGPKEKLDQTVHCQPAILVSSLAALERLRETNPMQVESCVATAGFSVGEITALVFAGVLSFEDAVRLVKVRAEGMQIASEISSSGMATVFYGADSKLNYSLVVAKEWCRREHNIENPVCSIANYLFPHCKVIAGNIEALEFLEMNYRDFNLRKVKRLPVSGAFHTELMRPAADPVKEILKKLTINRPRMPIFSNLTGYRYHSSEEVRRNLSKQIYKPVLWEQIIQNLYKRPKEHEYPTSFECGPGSSLSTVLKQVNAKAHKKCQAIH